MKVTALAGGVGGAKLLVGIAALDDVELTAIVNTGDDSRIYRVHVSPDIDICTYWLAGIADEDRGWGIAGDSFGVVDGLRTLGFDAWFSLGDRDFATCLLRTARLDAGIPLHQATREICEALGVRARVLPMSDDSVRTQIVARDGRTLDFQEYFVRERTEPEVEQVSFAGISDARPAPGVLDALAGAERVIVCPSNPIVSIGPILALPDVREALRRHPDVVAVSPIVRGVALKGPAHRMLETLGIGSSAAAVASLYRDFVTSFVVDACDGGEAGRVADLGVEPRVLDTIMSDRSASERLAKALVST